MRSSSRLWNLSTSLTARTWAPIARRRAEGLLVFDASGVTGHPDHVAATAAALLAAETRGRPVLGWTLPASVATRLNEEFGAGFVGHPGDEVDLVVAVDRTRQHVASRAHVSQALPGSVLWRLLELLGDTEHLRWLRREGQHTGADGAGLSRS